MRETLCGKPVTINPQQVEAMKPSLVIEAEARFKIVPARVKDVTVTEDDIQIWCATLAL